MGRRGVDRFARSDESTLLVAIVALLIAGIVSAIVLFPKPQHRFGPEAGALLAPPSDDEFADTLGSPAPPAPAIGEAAGRSGGAQSPQPRPAPHNPPREPGPGPGPETPPSPGNGFLPDLPVLPPIPPPPGPAAADASHVLGEGPP